MPTLSLAGSDVVREFSNSTSSKYMNGPGIDNEIRSGGVIAPSGPQSFGALGPGASGGADFAFTADPRLAPGQTITVTIQLQDGARNLGTASFNFTAGPAPCGGVRLVVSSSLQRTSASNVRAAVVIQNTCTLPANGASLTTARLGVTSGAPLPQSLGNIGPGDTISTTVDFPNSTPGASSTLNLGGTFTGGSFSSTRRVSIP